MTIYSKNYLGNTFYSLLKTQSLAQLAWKAITTEQRVEVTKISYFLMKITERPTSYIKYRHKTKEIELAAFQEDSHFTEEYKEWVLENNDNKVYKMEIEKDN